jgi:hypothetical protein
LDEETCSALLSLLPKLSPIETPDGIFNFAGTGFGCCPSAGRSAAAGFFDVGAGAISFEGLRSS